MSEFMDDDFWIRLANKLIAYGTGRYNIKKIKRLSTRAIKVHFYGLDSLLRRVLIQRYHKKKTLAAIGRELNMTPQGVYSHEMKALDSILKSALRTSPPLPLQCKLPENKMPLIYDPCYDRRQIKNVLTELSPRVIRQLEAGGYRTMKHLCRATTNDLKKIYGIGPVALQKVQQAVKVYHQDNSQFFREKIVIDSDPPRKPIYSPMSKHLFPKK